MALRVNTFSSATRFTEFYRKGVTLKSRVLKQILKQRGITQRQFAQKLGMTKQLFCRKLCRRSKFGKSEIETLVHILGASAAIKAIWFPTMEEKRRIQNYVWEGRMNNKYNPDWATRNETPAQKRKRAMQRLNAESGEDWEESEEFEDYILNCDELPSRVFMRRRNNV